METICLTNNPYLPSCRIEVTGQSERLVGDCNSFAAFALENRMPTPSPAYPCCVTGRGGLEVRTNDHVFNLEPETVRRLFLLSLSPGEYKALHKVAPNEFWTHDHFYTEDGQAIQPKCELT